MTGARVANPSLAVADVAGGSPTPVGRSPDSSHAGSLAVGCLIGRIELRRLTRRMPPFALGERRVEMLTAVLALR